MSLYFLKIKFANIEQFKSVHCPHQASRVRVSTSSIFSHKRSLFVIWCGSRSVLGGRGKLSCRRAWNSASLLSCVFFSLLLAELPFATFVAFLDALDATTDATFHETDYQCNWDDDKHDSDRHRDFLWANFIRTASDRNYTIFICNGSGRYLTLLRGYKAWKQQRFVETTRYNLNAL